MGTNTRNPQAAKPFCGGMRCASGQWLAGLGVPLLFVLGPSVAHAGFGVNSAPSHSVDNHALAISSDTIAADLDSLSQNVMTSSGSLDMDPLSADPTARGILLSGSALNDEATTDTPVIVGNALPKSTDAPPLLIPLPTAISAGAWGLLAVALLLGARRTLRRRLFA